MVPWEYGSEYVFRRGGSDGTAGEQVGEGHCSPHCLAWLGPPRDSESDLSRIVGMVGTKKTVASGLRTIKYTDYGFKLAGTM
jgi:hypothetical protein